MEDHGSSVARADPRGQVAPRADRHTPGPWLRSGRRPKVCGSDTHSIIATVDGKEIVIASVWYDPRTHEGFHDAGLMATAPELLESLREVKELLRFALLSTTPKIAVDAMEFIRKAEATIAKATGERP